MKKLIFILTLLMIMFEACQKNTTWQCVTRTESGQVVSRKNYINLDSNQVFLLEKPWNDTVYRADTVFYVAKYFTQCKIKE